MKRMFYAVQRMLIGGVGFIFGILFLLFISPDRHIRGDLPSHYPGFYYGYLHCRFMLSGDHEGMYYVATFTIRSESPVRWHWHRPDTFRYEDVQFIASNFSNGERTVEGKIRFPDLKYITSETSGELNPEILKKWLLPPEYPVMPDIVELHQFLENAAAGSLPPPRHHGHLLENELSAQITHGAMGMHKPLWLWILSLVWAGVVATWVTLGIRQNRPVQPGEVVNSE